MTLRTRGTNSAFVASTQNRKGLPGPVGWPIIFIAVLYLFASSRWGSYVRLPGLPFYIGDLFVAAAAAQTVVLARRAGTSWQDVREAVARAPLALLVTLALLALVVTRALVGAEDVIADPLVGLRDLAPYAYAIVVVLAFVLPTSDDPARRRAIYTAFSAHLTWILVLPHFAGFPWDLTLGNTAVFEARPDFDSAVLGIAAALALADLLHGFRGRALWRNVSLALFTLANLYALTTLLTRAGLIAGVVALTAVGLAWGLRGIAWRAVLGWRGVLLLAALVCLAGVALLSPPGQRLLDSFGGDDATSSGTLQARRITWSGVTEYVLSDARRTAVGVGFGPDFLTDSGTTDALEGDDYVNVRSPHNYVIGTLARLGMAGALLTGLLIVLAAALGVRALVRPVGAVSTVAALTVLCLPVTAMLGVVLESPFGSIPYFWAIGHLARSRLSERHGGDTGA